ncbi:Asp-tRNA(Asn)/Glu-tRNA(Gln) amidotransferase subunit GatC [Neobittarella massiliensis]|uniref:Asp-tRNA(Asn)/Glu-tRNA(Gln) amidotransferase subunit GatC n=2 Tax=Oscillospiraceae TaxID=216572 RepID=A0A8J6M131_9FIRM|nr:Asp-tRNA(Asn)/Glu-tRNA(Gln) amidotransferase subunit GatC [Neobittarella massiliensis]MBC3515731.1 Asp-tRNA(Asn)/Glu-tRNA(Gln) amidotransferase subunit GatC [Neobittarella massiliensis]SCJ47917.1 Glutamyl-tRNA(Gln) amidotransferase subunit C [uncultured Anaerotruncus sp.]
MDIDIRHIAKLANLKIEEKDFARYQKQMQDIIAMVESLPEQKDFDQRPDPADAMELREDIVKPSMPREKLLAGAPQVEAGCVVVPKTVSE